MNKLEILKKGWKIGKHLIQKNAPTLMAAGAMIGVGVTVGLTIKATPKAVEKVEAKKKVDPNITKLETVAVAVPEYAAALMAFLITEGLMFGSNHFNLKRITELGLLYSASVASGKDKDRIIEGLKEILGEEKVEEVKKKLGVETKSAFETEKELKAESVSKFDKNEIRPCLFELTGQISTNSYNGLWSGLEQCRVALSRDPIVRSVGGRKVDKVDYLPLAEVQYKTKFDPSSCGDYLGWSPDDNFRFNIAPFMVNGAAGWKVTVYPEPMPGFDSSH